jgi:uncharacterized protein (DUF2336 family)
MLLRQNDFVGLETALERLKRKAGPAAVQELADDLVASAGKLGPTELRVYDEVVRWLLRRSDGPARVAVAERVAAAAAGPDLTVRDLALDPEPAVAAPVLRRSPLVRNADLLEVARLRGDAHLQAIAERPDVAEPVADVVAARGSPTVLRTLAANPSASLSPAGLDRLARAARDDGDLAIRLLKRGDVPVRLTQELVQHAASPGVAGPQRRGGRPDPSRTAGPAAPRSLPSAGDLRRAEAQVAALNRHLFLSGDDVAWCLDHERWIEGLAVVARLAGHPVERAARAFVERRAEAMLALLFLAGARWEVAEQAVLLWGAAGPPRMAHYAAVYAGLTRPDAERALDLAGLGPP